MDALEALITRRSAVKLGAPAPPDEAVEAALGAALRAPDHGKLRPWKFLLIRGEARRRLGEVLAEALRARDPDVPGVVVEKEREKPLRAPLMIVVAAKIHPDHPKIPEIEQVVSAGAAAQNIMLAFHAQGFGCMWRTGAPAYDETVKMALGLEPHDHIVGFLYAGTHTAPPPEGELPEAGDFVVDWV